MSGEVCQYNSLQLDFRIWFSVSFTATAELFYIFYHTSAKSRRKKKKKNFFWFTEPQLCLKFKTRDCLHVLRGPKYLNSMVEITENATVEVTKDDKGQTHLS